MNHLTQCDTKPPQIVSVVNNYLQNLESIFINIIKCRKMIKPPALIASERALFHDLFKYTITHAVHKFCNTDKFTFSQAQMISLRSSPIFLYCFPSAYTVRLPIPQRFSMGFAGQFITYTPLCKNHSYVECATLMEALSYWNIPNRPPKGKRWISSTSCNQLHSSGLRGMQYSFGLDNVTHSRPLATVLVGVWNIFSPLAANRAYNRLHHPTRLN